MSLAILHRFASADGDAWALTLKALDGFCRAGARDVRPAAPHRGLRRSADGARRARGARLGPGAHRPVPALGGAARGTYRRAALRARRGHRGPERPTRALQSVLPALALSGDARFDQSGVADAAPSDSTSCHDRSVGTLGRSSRAKTASCLASGGCSIARSRHAGFVVTATTTSNRCCATGDAFTVIDFEGEPRRPLGERRLKRSPLHDVASMLRSFDYAARHTLAERGDGAAARHGRVRSTWQPWARFWRGWVCAAFLREYVGIAHREQLVPPDRDVLIPLLDVYLLERAIYELGYELEERPAWVAIPREHERATLSRLSRDAVPPQIGPYRRSSA